MIYTKTLKLLLVGTFCFVSAEFVCAEMAATQNGAVLTISDTGSNPDGSFTLAINRNNALIVKTSNDDFTGTVTQRFDASSIEEIRLFTGPGNDQVVFGTAINVNGTPIVQPYPNIDVHIQTGNGNDRVYVVGADIGDLSISTGLGDDLVTVSGDSIVNEDLSILTIGGNDDVSFQAIDVLGNTSVLTGSGIDTFETNRSLFVGRVDVDAGPNMDQISIGGPASLTNRANHFLGPVQILGGTGNDLINVDNGDYVFLSIDGGRGLNCYVPYGTFQFDSGFRLFNVDTCHPEFPYGSQHVYKTVGNRDLEMILIKPDDWEPSDKRPAILFFHGGSWRSGTPLQLLDQGQYFAKQGLVCVLVQYRLLDRDIEDEPPVICINDAKSAMRFVRSRAAQLGIDPDRIASSGASAGGHLAAFLGTTDGVDDPQDDLGVSARSNAMCLFCPIYDNGPGNYGEMRIGDRYPELSPAHNISPDDTPNIVFLGTEDHIIPIEIVRRFRTRMLAAGVRSELRLYDGASHAFFLKRFHDGIFYEKSLTAMHIFLRDLGWIEGPPSPADF